MKRLNDIDIRNSTLLSAFDQEGLEQIMSQGASIRVFNEGHILHHEGDACTHLDVLLTGKMIVENVDEDGRLLIITEFSKGDSVGSNLLFSSDPRYPMNIITKEECQILHIPRDVLLKQLFSNQKILLSFLKDISDNTVLLNNSIKHYATRSIRRSILYFLRREYLRQHSKTIQLPSSKKQMAQTWGIQRSSLSRELKKMREEGLIDYDIRSITILSSSILKDLDLN